jgi:hypothetical protein
LIVTGDLLLHRGLNVTTDSSLNRKLAVGGDVSLAGITELASTLKVAGDSSFNSKLYVAGDTSFGSAVDISGALTLTGDASMNGRLNVAGDVSLNGDLTIEGNLNVLQQQNTSIINTTVNNYEVIISNDLSVNGDVKATGDASFGGNLYLGGAIDLIGDASFNNNLYVAGDVSFAAIPELASALTPSTDYQLATKKYVDDAAGGAGIDPDSDVSLNQGLVVAGDTLLGINTYNKLVSSVVKLTFGDSPSTTSLGTLNTITNMHNVGTTDGNNDTLMTGSDSQYGNAVAISDDGTIVAIGADFAKFQNYNRLGYVEIKQYNSSGGWTRIGLLVGANGNLPNSGNNNVQFGAAVALNGDGTILAVSAPYNPSGGIVQVYQYSSGSWSQLGSDITGSGRLGDTHGTLSLNTDGTILAIGDRYDSTGTGVARVYEYIGGSWSQLGSDIAGEAASDSCGTVSLNSSGTILAVGARNNDGNGSNAGHVRVFEYSGGSWSQLGSDIDGEAADDHSGIGVSINGTGTIVAIGADANDGNGDGAGHVRVYEYSGGSWSQLGSDIDGEAARDRFGISVSINSGGDTVLIGASETFESGQRWGYVKMFHYSSGTWAQVGDKQIGTHYQDNAGVAVALSRNDSIAIYGASWYSTDIQDGGSAHVFQVEKTIGIVNTYALTRGLVGIGVSRPSCEVDISGTMKVSGDISLDNSSNSRLFVQNIDILTYIQSLETRIQTLEG